MEQNGYTERPIALVVYCLSIGGVDYWWDKTTIDSNWSVFYRKTGLTLLGLAYLSVSKEQGGGHIVPPLNYLGVGLG